MSDPILPALPGSITRGFLALAQQRRANLIDMYETGRWRHYYTEAQFMDRMREVVGLNETWDRIAGSGRASVAPDGSPGLTAAE